MRWLHDAQIMLRDNQEFPVASVTFDREGWLGYKTSEDMVTWVPLDLVLQVVTRTAG